MLQELISACLVIAHTKPRADEFALRLWLCRALCYRIQRVSRIRAGLVCSTTHQAIRHGPEFNRAKTDLLTVSRAGVIQLVLGGINLSPHR